MKVRTDIKAGEGVDFDLENEEETDQDSLEGSTQDFRPW